MDVIESNGKNGRFDWKMGLLLLAGWSGSWLIQVGSTNTKLDDHARRLDNIEHRLEERSLSREEFDKRHSELERRVEKSEQAILDIERRRK